MPALASKCQWSIVSHRVRIALQFFLLEHNGKENLSEKDFQNAQLIHPFANIHFNEQIRINLPTNVNQKCGTIFFVRQAIEANRNINHV